MGKDVRRAEVRKTGYNALYHVERLKYRVLRGSQLTTVVQKFDPMRCEDAWKVFWHELAKSNTISMYIKLIVAGKKVKEQFSKGPAYYKYVGSC